MGIQEAAYEFYSRYKIVAFGRGTEEIDKNIFRFHLPLNDGGLALGISDENNNIVVFNTYVTREMLQDKQLAEIEEDKEINELLRSLNQDEYQVILETMRNLKTAL